MEKMKKFILLQLLTALALIVLIFFYLWTFAASSKIIKPLFHDGDTFKLYDSSLKKNVSYRIMNIDCPELKQFYGINARDSIQKLFYTSNFRINKVHIDRYNRILCEVFIDDKRIDSIIVSNGWGYVYPKYCNYQKLYLIQNYAKSKQKGVWMYSNLKLPWDFRHNN